MNNEEMFMTILNRMDTMGNSFSKLEGKVDKLDGRMDKLEDKVDNLEFSMNLEFQAVRTAISI